MALYSTIEASKKVLLSTFDQDLPVLPEIRELVDSVEFSTDSAEPLIPIVLKAHESFAALKGLEGIIAVALCKKRFGEDTKVKALVNCNHAALFPAMSFLSTVDGIPKWGSEMKNKIMDTDLHHVYSNTYRRMLTNIYRTKDGGYYHLHASLNATPTLAALGLPPYDEGKTEKKLAQRAIEASTQQYTSEDLDKMIRHIKQAGSPCLTRAEFLASSHGKYISSRPLFELSQLESTSPTLKLSLEGPNILSGVKILDLSRVIAGPVISRTLAEYGAQVLRVTNHNLPDQSYYAVDFNFGKRTIDLDLKSSEGRQAFEKLLEDVDVIVDGYRPGAIAKLGYGPDELLKRFSGKRGFVYVKESCYGDGGEWSDRPGWQQIADSVTGVSWANGQALGLEEPVAPPFPLADFGAGELGCIATLNALHHRLTKGGSYYTSVSLVKYNDWLMSLGSYPEEIWRRIASAHGLEHSQKLNRQSNFDDVGLAAIASINRLHPHLWKDPDFMQVATNTPFGTVKTQSPIVKIVPFKTASNGWLNVTRPAGYDPLADWV
ncbi:CoA-transferase family III domain-containing protein [Lentinula lateritia]|uniref:CoA-transferase family III domain-containing protein n=1 Tax=Lentinula aff. lateritia TaxID=2804960 RepID=A0ACC1UCP7_9AGAR|nr:CoA-transferase family III domain-containing protein [Lentinula aff. lateritia]KAJ3855395.1 CoA-transferase family III domain-containing protein [Lentinula lateritia]